MGEVSQEEIRAAMERYPGLPAPLAVSKYMLDRLMECAPVGELLPGLMWGGVHLERVGENVQLLAEAMYQQSKRAITITLTATDFPETWDHFEVEVKDVDSGPPGASGDSSMDKLWSCLCCAGDDHTIREGGKNINLLQLRKLARWPYLASMNVLIPESEKYPLANAVVCDRCLKEKREINYAMAGEPGENGKARYYRVPIDDLQDPEFYWPDHHPDRQNS